LDKNHLMRLAGRFSRRLRGYAYYADLGIVDTMPSSGLCRVNLDSCNDDLE
jgi:hypothetical protein